MNKTFFVSDQHFGHARVIQYSNRPFKSSDEMDEELIKRHNNKVGKTDLVYFLGDVFFHNEERAIKIINRLNGIKILVYGNHDKVIKKSKVLISMFYKVCDYLEISIQDNSLEHGKQNIVLSHFPFLTWNKSHYGSWCLHGHCHGTMKYPFEGKILDVGVDVHNYEPISYEEIKAIMDKKKFQPIDHHE